MFHSFTADGRGRAGTARDSDVSNIDVSNDVSKRLGVGSGRDEGSAKMTMGARGFGLFDPAQEKASCGVGFIADI